jgi:hypothetical protein
MSDSYKDPRWQKLRLEVMNRDGWACVACLDAGTSLQVHHLDYHGELWETPMDQLQTLCEDCHKVLGKHPKGGIYWVRSKIDGNPFLVVRHCPFCRSDSFSIERKNLLSVEGMDGQFERLYCDKESCDWWYPLFIPVLFRTWEYHPGEPRKGDA